MSDISNPRALRGDQYKTDKNLNARIALHERFSTNPGSWHGWVFEHLELEAGQRVLELGCGPGNLWAENLERAPKEAQILLSDFSPGMLRAAQGKLAGQPQFRFVCWDAQRPAAAAASFDRVIANHMLYHLPDVPAALGQARQLLKPDGVLCASTNGKQHLRDIWLWVLEALPGRKDALEAFENVYSFSVENGKALLSDQFAEVDYYAWKDSLSIDEVQPLVDFVASSSMMARLDEEELAMFGEHLRRKLAQEKVLRATKNMGIFVARRPL